jgi:hypothetical protein
VQPCSLQDLSGHHSEVDQSILLSGGSYFLQQSEEVVATDLMGTLDLSTTSNVDPPGTPALASTLDRALDAPAAGAAHLPKSTMSPYGSVQVPTGPGPPMVPPKSPWVLGSDSDVDHAGSSTPALHSPSATPPVTRAAAPATRSSALGTDPGASMASGAPSSTPPPRARTRLQN